jgi:peroxiredoxin Q/BCP
MPRQIELKLKEGDKAPDFVATTHTGEKLALKDLRGKPVVLYFYPKDDTPGCTIQACGLRDSYGELKRAGAVVLGVSPDPVKSHVKFITKFQLPFTLLADEDKSIANAYGVWGEKSFMGRKYMGNFRVTFLVDANGRIAKIWPAVKPETHSAEVLDAIKQLPD